MIARVRALMRDPAGVRFTRHHERARAASVRGTALAVVGGGLLVVAGVVIGLVPGPGGSVVVVLGLVSLAGASRRVAGALDRLELALRRRFRRFFPTPERTP